MVRCQVPTEGGEPELLTEESFGGAEWSGDGQRLFFWKRGEKSANIWALSIRERSTRAMTDLAGRHGRPVTSLAADEHYFYFAWRDDVGDIWVMDVVE